MLLLLLLPSYPKLPQATFAGSSRAETTAAMRRSKHRSVKTPLWTILLLLWNPTAGRPQPMLLHEKTRLDDASPGDGASTRARQASRVSRGSVEKALHQSRTYSAKTAAHEA